MQYSSIQEYYYKKYSLYCISIIHPTSGGVSRVCPGISKTFFTRSVVAAELLAGFFLGSGFGLIFSGFLLTSLLLGAAAGTGLVTGLGLSNLGLVASAASVIQQQSVRFMRSCSCCIRWEDYSTK